MHTELEPDDYYINEQGYKVFTEKYHLKRGYCCSNGCKHCPYGFHEKNKVKNSYKGVKLNEKKQF
ncbi:MAG: DUF5522 domain-containing protein [Bacteroidia bacterium]|nr:DUF5522 domain-containing protein [Bacteroidia bacterium]MDW8347784.1 DUF5522 domain-containing protein [Bacteroidia bacterium]